MLRDAGRINGSAKEQIFSDSLRASSNGWPFWLSVGLSLALHLVLASYLLEREADFGAVEVPTAAISINLQTTDIFNASADGLAEQAAAAEAVSESMVSEQEREAQEQEKRRLVEDAERQRAEEQARQKLEAKDRAGKEPETGEKLTSEKRETQEPEKPRHAEKAGKETQAEAPRKNRRARASAGASGSHGSKASNGRVSASKGDILNYAARVNAHIARNKPRGQNARGRVVIRFSISTSGRLISAQIAHSSGNSNLDSLALIAVRRSSPFPEPPRGVGPRQLRFSYPVTFR